MRKIFHIVLIFILPCSLYGQNQWDLGKCIDYALQHNIQIKKSEFTSALSSKDILKSKAELFPTLNGFASNTYNFGQTIDPFTNQFVQDRVRSNSFSVNSSVTLFNGLQNINTIKRNQLEFKASEKDVEKVKNDISLNIATAYLQILFNEELVKVAENQLQVTEKQLERIKKLVDAGSLPKGNALDIEAQLANEELQLINSQNQLQLSYLNLKQMIELDTVENFRIVKPEIEVPASAEIKQTPGQVYDAAQRVLPDIASASYRVQSAEKGLSIAKGSRSPVLSFNGSFGTGFSQARKEVADVQQVGYDTVGFVPIGTDVAEVLVPSYESTFQTKPFMEQINDNLNQTVGISLSIPVFNGFSSRTAISKARISRKIAELDLEQVKKTVYQDIQKAYSDAVAALKKYHATKKSVEALEESFKYAQQRFDVGLVNAVEFNDSKNKLTKAQSDLLQAKYDYIFKTKILDFYQGKSLVF